MVEVLVSALRLGLGLGVEPNELTWWQMGLRALIVYVAALAMVRLGDKRFLGKLTAFDVILGIILGSVVSRAINGSAPLFETLVAGFVLVILHWLFAEAAFHSSRFGTLVKGRPRTLVREGEIQWDEMRKSSITEGDLVEALRIRAKLSDPSEVKLAHLERRGEISVIPRDAEPKIVEIQVAEGVQRVRIELKTA